MTHSSDVPGGTSAVARRIYLHVGAPKTGTTFLQNMLHAHRDQLAQDGVLYPTTTMAAHHNEARDLRNVRLRDGSAHNRSVPGAWQRMLRTVGDWDGDGDVVLSSELLAFANTAQASHAVRSLQPHEVHLVITVRDLVRQIPAVWQETVKNRGLLTFEEFVRRLVESDPSSGPQRIWVAQDPGALIARWAQDLPPEHVHIVTVPPRGAQPGLLWERFASVVGFDPAGYSAVTDPANTSLGVAEAEVVRRVNRQTKDASWHFYARYVKRGLAQQVFAGSAVEGNRLVLPESALPWVQARTKQIIDEVSGRGYDVVGSLDELLPAEDGSGSGPLPAPDGERLGAASAKAADYLARELARAARRSPAQAGGPRPGPAGPKAPRPRARGGRGGLRTRLSTMSDQYRVVGAARGVYRRARRLLPR